MTESGRNIAVGLTTIVAIAAFLALLLVFGEFDRWTHERYAVTLLTENAVGLRAGSQVELNGVTIGRVDSVRALPRGTYPVEIIIQIDQTTLVPQSAVPYAETSLLGGGSVLQFIAAPEPEGVEGRFMTTGDDAVLEGPIRFRLIEEISAQLDARLDPLERALATFEELSRTYIELGRTIDAFVTTDDEGAVDLTSTLTRLSDLVREADETIAAAREWFDDGGWQERLNATLDGAAQLVGDGSDAIKRYERLADEIETRVAALDERLLPVADEVAATLEEVRGLVRKADRGEGTVARMLNDPTLYNSMNDAAQRLERALVELQLLIQKTKQEGVKVDL
jgi:phospholipid/cholesterol/gamma-HCH transport system substrate-binding protein